MIKKASEYYVQGLFVLFLGFGFSEFYEMKIQEWFKNGCNYNEGVELYSQLSPKRNLLVLFKRAENNYNREKLKGELKQFLTVKTSVVQLVQPEQKKQAVNIIDTSPDHPSRIKSIASYPPSLHSVYKKRVASFYDACTLKMQLNSLPEDAVKEALELQFQIYELWKVNDECFRILNHYDETKRIMPVETDADYSSLSPQQLVQERQRLYANISKRKKTIENLQSEILSLEGKKRVHKENMLNQKKEELQVMQLKIKTLTQLINK